jgi:hypothetical protein
VTLKAYTDVFVRAAEHCYTRRFMKRDVLSFLDALGALASVGHILLEASLEALSHTRPRESLAEYSYNCDVKAMHREFKWQMTHLEQGIRNTSTIQAVGQVCVHVHIYMCIACNSSLLQLDRYLTLSLSFFFENIDIF